MLRFHNARDAVAAVRELMTAITAHGLPPAHSGVAAGRFVVRDGDVYGHTVNLAARIAAHGVSGEMLIPASTAESLIGAGLVWEDVGEVLLKGIAEPVDLVRIRP